MTTSKIQGNIELLQDEITRTRDAIKELTYQLNQQGSILVELEREMFRACDHNWVIDDSVFDIHSRSFMCTKCKLLK